MVAENNYNILSDQLGQIEMTILNIKVGIIADRLVRVVLDNVAVHDVGLARLHVVVFNDGGQ